MYFICCVVCIVYRVEKGNKVFPKHLAYCLHSQPVKVEYIALSPQGVVYALGALQGAFIELFT